MIADNSPLTKIDQNAERRRALAKVYSLLIRLADEVQSDKSSDLLTVQTPKDEVQVADGQKDSTAEIKEVHDVALKSGDPS